MGYDEIVKGCELLGYRDKFRLAQLLIQIARKEEEIHNPQNRIGISKEESYKETAASEKNSIEYVMERIEKLAEFNSGNVSVSRWYFRTRSGGNRCRIAKTEIIEN
ncbi:hypothetical protein LDFHOB_01635 [Candidatus Electronema aureum]